MAWAAGAAAARALVCDLTASAQGDEFPSSSAASRTPPRSRAAERCGWAFAEPFALPAGRDGTVTDGVSTSLTAPTPMSAAHADLCPTACPAKGGAAIAPPSQSECPAQALGLRRLEAVETPVHAGLPADRRSGNGAGGVPRGRWVAHPERADAARPDFILSQRRSFRADHRAGAWVLGRATADPRDGAPHRTSRQREEAGGPPARNAASGLCLTCTSA
jgi:hypothetical protein